MWNIDQIQVIPIELDFTSSGQGRCSGTAIEADGIFLFNALEYVDVGATATQVEVCECCGVHQCSPGGWVVFRRLGDSVVWLPVWSEMEKGEWERTEYRPPSFFETRGVPVIALTVWEELRRLYSALPATGDIPRVDSREAVRWIQWSAPGRILGQFPDEPKLQHEVLVAVAEGELAEEAAFVDGILHLNFTQPVFLDLVEPAEIPSPIEFFLDLPGTPAWANFAHLQADSCLLVGERLALRRTS